MRNRDSKRGWRQWVPVTLVLFLVVGILAAAGGQGGESAPGGASPQATQPEPAPSFLPTADDEPSVPRKRFTAVVGPYTPPALTPKAAFNMPVTVSPGETILVPVLVRNESTVATQFNLQILPEGPFTVSGMISTTGSLTPVASEAEAWEVSLKIPSP